MSFFGDIFSGIFGGGAGSEAFDEAARRSGSIVDALLHPEGKTFQRLAQFEEDRINFDLAERLKQLMIQNQRGMARGAPLLNPERRDESIAKASTWGMAMAPFSAREAARDYLSKAAAANAGILGIAPYAAQQQQSAAQFGGNTLAAILAGGQSLFGGGLGLLNGAPQQSGYNMYPGGALSSEGFRSSKPWLSGI